ncbi:MAG: Na+:solute symporter [Bacteriovoracaceae bacterium]|nr:Na+:solute symporter [Bacteriovoracaceae bacterium]
MVLSWLDWSFIICYLIFTLFIGFWASKDASKGTESYFLAGRNLPWWWTGTSVAATTFAADTPLAITGIIATKGISGNWIWLSSILLHCAVIFLFASNWRKSQVLTDSELIAIRYSGKSAKYLRSFRAFLYGIIINCIILGWVLRAMVKIVKPFFHWESWTPSLYQGLLSIWPENFVLGSPSEGLTIISLLALVAVYSTAGGIRGVILTDLVQFFIALFGSFIFAYFALQEVGGLTALNERLITLYGQNHHYLDLFPSSDSSWFSSLQVGAFSFGLYLWVQSFSSSPADGGGYLMQRLGTCKTPEDARKATLLFVLLQYCVRIWPWFIVALCALVLIPLGQEGTVFQGMAQSVAADRESAYSVLMGLILKPGFIGILLVSLLAAFMSTIDTHINWGASYIVNDFYCVLFPNSTSKSQIKVARLTVSFFAILAILVASQITTIERAWQWMAALGAGLGFPTIMRWFWWRINAISEILAIIVGVSVAVILHFTSIPYEVQLICIAFAGIAGTLAGVFLGKPADEKTLNSFIERIDPMGFWNDKKPHRTKNLLVSCIRLAVIFTGFLLFLKAGQLVLMLNFVAAILMAILGAATIFASIKMNKLAAS